jgi:hypothetical protein
VVEGSLSFKQKSYIICLACIIHIVLLLSLLIAPAHQSFSLFLQTTNTQKNIPTPIHTDTQHPEQWAATKACPSRFGAPVLFFDPPDNYYQEQTSSSLSLPVNSADTGDENSQSPTIEKLAQSSAEPINPYEASPDPSYTSKNGSETLHDTKHLDTVSLVNASKHHTISKNTATQSTKIAGKQPLTLAHITKGFLDQLSQNGGAHAVTMRGDKNKIPTDEQLKHERYLARLQWCIQNAMKIHETRYTQKNYQEKTSLDIYLAIDKDGLLKELVLLRSSGITELDAFMLFVFENASGGFPSVPEFFKKDLYTIVFTVKFNESIEHGFGMHIK